MKNILFVAALLTATATDAIAQENSNKEKGFYAELGLAQAYYKESSVNFSNAMGTLKAGYNINRHIAAEVMAGGNLNSAGFYYGTTKVDAYVSGAYGAYGKISLPLSDAFSLFIKLGVTSATVSASTRYGSGYSSNSDISYGGGAQFNFTPNVYGQFDYTSYYNKNGVSVVAPSVSVGYKF